MDSFYDAPRRAPNPRSQICTDKVLPSLVPEVSILVQNNAIVPPRQMSYNTWRTQNNLIQPVLRLENKENMLRKPMQSSLCRKQVRFESPQQQELRFKPPLQRGPVDDSFTLSNFQAPKLGPVRNNILQAKPFEKMYMANIPNRSLDLSIIEPAPILHQTRRIIRNPMNSKECKHAAESTTIEPKPNDEPTVKDLLKIIQQQNEQLMCLQKQVTTLIQERNIPQQDTPQPITVFKNKPLEPKNGLPKFAIDVMTSFEVSIRAPNKFSGGGRKFANEQPKICELLESAKIKEIDSNKNADVSLTLNEPLVVQQECQSPDNSIHVDMQDFSSDEDENSSSESSLIGWTIYNNVMGQVNYLLKKSQDGQQNQPATAADTIGGSTMKKVKEATLRHLKNVGVHLPNLPEEESNISSENSSECSPTEISFAVKQLLMKYLPDEHLAKLTERPTTKTKNTYPTNLIRRRPEFSMATVQYMEKYNLLNSVGGKQLKSREGKLLDITALKQQPKLL